MSGSDPQCALVRAASEGVVGMFAMFGGQGYSYFDELRAAYTFNADTNSGGEELVVSLINRSAFRLVCVTMLCACFPGVFTSQKTSLQIHAARRVSAALVEECNTEEAQASGVIPAPNPKTPLALCRRQSTIKS